MLKNLLASAGLAAAVMLLYALFTSRLEVPPRWNPWAPLQVADAPNALTRFKLARLGRDDALCQEALASSQLRYTPLEDRVTGPGCGFSNAVQVSATSAQLAPALALSCRTAVSLALWERHVLQPAAEIHFSSEVTRLEHFGSYACRNVYSREGARRSQHATADAIDIAGFVMADGRRVRLLSDWEGDGPGAAFLREVHAGACRYFDGALGPNYNAAHRDHFHFDRGAARICR
jgi:hypothetical protein